METYDVKSCNSLEKPYYRPIEAALRWCNLIQHEVKILEATDSIDLLPPISAFPQWPCLRANAEKIVDAILNCELPHGRDGKTVGPDDHVARHRLTVRHTDLKAWMAKHFPDQKPKFLFDEIERTTHSAINADSFRALQADLKAAQGRIDKATDIYREQKAKIDELNAECERLRVVANANDVPGTRSESTYLNIIGGLVELMLETTPGGRKGSVYESQASIVSALLERHKDKAGISKTTIELRFAAAHKSLKSG